MDGGNYGGAGSIDNVPIDPDWLVEVKAYTPSAHPERPFDWSQVNQDIPFTFDLGSEESVAAATLTLGIQGTAGGSTGVTSDAVIFSFNHEPAYYRDLD